ncbi:MAG: hypothetical protein S4CHLAM20_11190 [Chlamydiia bacterium]|nr:hypothetical protein [Chlamydiia bacterium]
MSLKPTIVNLEGMDLLFVRKTGSYQNAPKEAFIELLKFAKKHPKLIKARKFGIAQDNPQITAEENLRFDACLIAPK